MSSEGSITSSTKALVKSEMLRKLWSLERTTPDLWEREVFTALTGYEREAIDWSFENNLAGYYTWIKAFDGLIEELIEDGYVRVEEHGNGERTLIATEADAMVDLSQMADPSR